MPGNAIGVSLSASFLSDGFDMSRTVYTDNVTRTPITLTAAKTGTLSTRTSTTVGILTMAAGHGITTGALLDIYWTNTDGTTGRRYQVTVGTVATNSVPFSLGAGDNLPIATTAIRAMVPHPETIAFAAAAIQVALAKCPQEATVVFLKADLSIVAVLKPEGSPTGAGWVTGLGTTPFADDVATVYYSHGDSGATQVVTTVLGYN